MAHINSNDGIIIYGGTITTDQLAVGINAKAQKISDSRQILPGDITALRNSLIEYGVSNNDIKELESLMDEDNKNSEDQFSGSIGCWIQKLLEKASTGTISVGVDTISSAVVKAIAAYYGLST